MTPRERPQPAAPRSTAAPAGVGRAKRRPRQVLQPVGLDCVAAGRAGAVRARVQALERAIDLAENVAGVLLERVVDLAVDGLRGGVGGMIIGAAGDEVTGFVLERTGVLLVQIRDRVEDVLPLFLEAFAEAVGIDLRAHLPALASRRSTSAGSIPASSTIFSRPDRPETSETLDRGSSRRSATRDRTASFALPCSGGAATRTFQPPPCRTIAPRPVREPGATRRRRRVEIGEAAM